MKSTIKVFWVIAFVAIIAFAFVSCDDGDNDLCVDGHTWGEWTEVEAPTADEPGSEERKCTVCGAHYTNSPREIPPTGTTDPCAAGHAFPEWIAPTCTTEGNSTRTCTREGCNEQDTRTTGYDKISHTFPPNWTVIKAATLFAAGSEERKCTECGEHYTASPRDIARRTISWTTSGEGRVWAAGQNLRSVAWGNGMFIAVGNDGNIARSTDGISWTGMTHTGDHLDIAFGSVGANGTWVVKSRLGQMSYSTNNGASWTNITAGTEPNQSQFVSGTDINGIAFGGGKFVAVGRNRQTAAHSEDGITWLQSGNIHASSVAPTAIAWGNNRFVVATNNGFKYSQDGGATWQDAAAASFPTDGDHISGIAYGNGRFVAVGGDADGHWGAHSTDGHTWNLIESDVFFRGDGDWDELTDIAFGDGVFVAVGSRDGWEGSHIMYSADGITWHEAESPFEEEYETASAVAWNGERFVVISDWRHSAYFEP